MTETANSIKRKRIVIVGAGFGGVYAFRRLHRYFHRNPLIELVLVNPQNYFLFTPLLHEVATGGVEPGHIVEPLREVLGCCLSDFWQTTVTKVQLANKTLETSLGQLPYDYLVLASGAETNFYGTPGAAEYALTLKTLGDAIRLRNHCIDTFERASKIADQATLQRELSFVVVGGGPTGVELIAELAEFVGDAFARVYPRTLLQNVSLTLVHAGDELIPQFPSRLRQKSQAVLERKGIKVRLGATVQAVDREGVVLKDGNRIEASTVIWVAGVRPTHPIFDTELQHDDWNRLIVNNLLQLERYPEVSVLGDTAAVHDSHGHALPALAQVAVQQATTVGDNIAATIKGKSPQPFRYHHRGDLLSLGQWMAVGEIGGFPFAGHLAWWIWRTVYLSKVLSFRKKLEVALDWTLDLFSPRDISKL